MGKNKQLLGHMAAFTTAVGWGLTFVAATILLRQFSPFEIPFFRFILATAALYLIYPKPLGKTTFRQELLFAGAGLIGVTLYFFAENVALLHTSASNVGVIVAVAPVFTALLVWGFFGGERPSKLFFLGFLLSIVGIGLISFSDVSIQLSLLGDFLALLAALCWGFYSVFMKKIHALGFHVIPVTRRIFLYGLLFLIPAMIATDFRPALGRFADLSNLISMLLLGLGASAAGFVLWNYALKKLGPVKTTVYVYLLPLVTLLASVLILGEIITRLQIIGIALTLLGLIISNSKPKKRQARSS